ncbi:MAG: rhomboid family intramembrane serine protease [Acidobacteria bacterium]|nr:rhomboid family intramembrane serine protease [Acidobacteriota bacterium]
MFKRQKTGSVVCVSCGSLVGVNDPQCYSCGRRNPGLWGYAPLLRRLGNDLGFVSLIVYGCGAMYGIALLLTVVRGGNIMGGGNNPLNILAPDTLSQVMLGASGAYPVFGAGLWWSVLSAGWLHASIMHIVLNMMWVKNLGPATADLYGGPRMVIIYTVGSASGFLLSSVLGLYPIPKFGAPLTVGASAPIFGLLGALMYYGRRSGSSIVHAEAKGYAVAFFVFGLIFPGVDNAAHAGGFLGGYLSGMWLDPLKPERVNHMIGALVCLAATALAILASIVSVLPAFLSSSRS